MRNDLHDSIAFAIYDINNLPVSIYKLNGQSQIYSYDVNGSRVQKSIVGSTSTFYVNDPTGKTEAVQTGTANSVYTYNIWGNDMVGQVKDNAGNLSRFYYLKDHLPSKIICMSGWRKALIGEIKVVLNQSGNVDSYNDFYPFGLQMPNRNQAGTADGRFKFTGKEQDVETGYDWFDPTRGYDSWRGMFNCPDPHGNLYPWSSPYAYVLDNPLNATDPDGKDLKMIYRTPNGDFGHIILQVVNGQTGKVMATWSFGPADNSLYNKLKIGAGVSVKGEQIKNTDAYLKGKESESATIKTDEKSDNATIEEINKKIGENEDYNLYNNNCATSAVDIVKDAGIPIKDGSILPASAFKDFKEAEKKEEELKKQQEQQQQAQEEKKDQEKKASDQDK